MIAGYAKEGSVARVNMRRVVVIGITPIAVQAAGIVVVIGSTTVIVSSTGIIGEMN